MSDVQTKSTQSKPGRFVADDEVSDDQRAEIKTCCNCKCTTGRDVADARPQYEPVTFVADNEEDSGDERASSGCITC